MTCTVMPHAGRAGILSRFKQSDMCLVCIAFASWVLRSADPESADTWKAGKKICIDIPLTFIHQTSLKPQKDFSLKEKESSINIYEKNQT